MEVLAEIQFGDTIARYVTDARGRVGLILFPSRMQNSLATRRLTLRCEPFIDSLPDSKPPAAVEVDSLVHLKIVGDPYPGAFAQGRTMRNAPSIDRFRFAGQEQTHEGNRTVTVTRLARPDGIAILHRMAWHDGDLAAEVTTELCNSSSRSITLEMLSSFALGGLTPFDPADAPGRLNVHHR